MLVLPSLAQRIERPNRLTERRRPVRLAVAPAQRAQDSEDRLEGVLQRSQGPRQDRGRRGRSRQGFCHSLRGDDRRPGGLRLARRLRLGPGRFRLCDDEPDRRSLRRRHSQFGFRRRPFCSRSRRALGVRRLSGGPLWRFGNVCGSDRADGGGGRSRRVRGSALWRRCLRRRAGIRLLHGRLRDGPSARTGAAVSAGGCSPPDAPFAGCAGAAGPGAMAGGWGASPGGTRDSISVGFCPDVARGSGRRLHVLGRDRSGSPVAASRSWLDCGALAGAWAAATTGGAFGARTCPP